MGWVKERFLDTVFRCYCELKGDGGHFNIAFWNKTPLFNDIFKKKNKKQLPAEIM